MLAAVLLLFLARGAAGCRGPTQRTLRVISYNTMSLRAVGRVPEVLGELGHVDVLVMQGTRLQADQGGYEVRTIEDDKEKRHLVVDFGYKRGEFTNRSAGVTMVLGRRFRRAHVVRIASPPPQLAGRGGLVRLRQPDADVTVVGLYFPPRPPEHGQLRQWRRAIDSLVGWLQEMLESTPARSMPILAMDLNSGLQYDEAGAELEVNGQGDYATGVANYAGEQMAQVMRTHHLIAYNTMVECGHTYFGPRGEGKTLDYIMGPAATRHTMRRCTTLARSARRLQIIPDTKPRDHLPLQVEMDYALGASRTRCTPRSWDYDAIAKSLQTGDMTKHKFYDTVEAEMSKVDWADLEAKTLVDEHWRRLVACITTAAQEHYARKPNETPADEQDLKRRRNEVLAARAEKREQMLKGDDEAMWMYNELHWELKKITHDLRSVSRRRYDKWKVRIEGELWRAWSDRHLAECYRLSNMLAGRRLGAKNRKMGHLPGTRPDVAQWREFLQRDGGDGGLQAEYIDYDEECSKMEMQADEVGPITANHTNDAHRDYDGMLRALKRGTKRRSSPGWSLPSEFYLMCMATSYCSAKRRRLEGVGAPAGPYSEMIQDRMAKLLLHHRRVGLSPAQAHLSQCYLIDKGGGQPGPGGIRIVHGCCPFWSSFYRHLMKVGQRQKKPQLPSYCFGFMKGRRKEDAMLCVRLAGWRLRHDGRDYIQSFHDMRNAFGSTRQDLLKENISELIDEPDQRFMMARFTNFVCKMDVDDEEGSDPLYFMPRSGSAMGTAEAPRFFLQAFMDAVVPWNIDMRDYTKNLTMTSPFDLPKTDGTLATYADDLARVLEVPRRTAQEAKEIIDMNNNILDGYLGPCGFGQNRTKQDIVPSLGKQGMMKRLANLVEAKVVPAARHLGGQVTWNNGFAPERDKRLAALRRGWRALGQYWFASTPWGQRRIMIIVRLQGAALTGLESYWTTTASDLKQINNLMLYYLRAILRGKSYDYHNKVKWTNEKVWMFWRLCPAEVELRVRRLGWLQHQVRHRQRNAHLLNMVWGMAKFENEPTLREGRPTEDCNPMARLFYDDITKLAQVAVEEEFSGMWQEKPDIVELFRDGSELGEAFMKVDRRIVRATYWDECKRRANCYGPEVEEVQEEVSEDVTMHYCRMRGADGAECGRAFLSLNALRAHMRFAYDGEHGTYDNIYRGTLSNQCPWCMSTFASRGVAIHHATAAYRLGRCRVDQSKFEWPVRPDRLECPWCEELPAGVSGQWENLQRHIRECHLPRPPPDYEVQLSDAVSSDYVSERIRRRWLERRAQGRGAGRQEAQARGGRAAAQGQRAQAAEAEGRGRGRGRGDGRRGARGRRGRGRPQAEGRRQRQAYHEVVGESDAAAAADEDVDGGSVRHGHPEEGHGRGEAHEGAGQPLRRAGEGGGQAAQFGAAACLRMDGTRRGACGPQGVDWHLEYEEGGELRRGREERDAGAARGQGPHLQDRDDLQRRHCEARHEGRRGGGAIDDQ